MESPAHSVPPHTTTSLRLVVVAPVFNHGAAIGAVLRALATAPYPVIVVNDGSTDATAQVLARWRGAGTHAREVVAHRHNLGKAAALRAGFARASQRGFTHALTIDTDGQHDVADVAAMVCAAEGKPAALIIGVRVRGPSDSPAPWASRVGRALSNGLVWCESGVRTADSQSGMRVYPLGAMGDLDGGAGRYGFETQVISRAGWLGVPVVEVPIWSIYAPHGGRTSHFRLVVDSLRAAAMHAGLLARALLFVPADAARACGPVLQTGSIAGRLLRWLSPRSLLAMARGEVSARKRLAASVGVGLAMAAMPLYGVKTVTCLWLAARFRLHPLAVVGVSSLSTPPLGFVFVFASAVVGHLLVRGAWPTGLDAPASTAGLLGLLRTGAAEWALGGVVVAAVLGPVGYLVALALLYRVPRGLVGADPPRVPVTPLPPAEGVVAWRSPDGEVVPATVRTGTRAAAGVATGD
ncbi:MAG: DUF2062 domain-containing protein [Phycisphaerales bacterium]